MPKVIQIYVTAMFIKGGYDQCLLDSEYCSRHYVGAEVMAGGGQLWAGVRDARDPLSQNAQCHLME